MKIALDAMGGDFGPPNLVAGAVMALRNYQQIKKLYLVGDSTKIENELRKHQCNDSRIDIVHSTQVVDMSDRAWTAVRRKKDSSVSRAVDLVKRGDADAVVSAGHTGAAVAASMIKLRTLQGVDRPGIAAVLPTQFNVFVLVDAGANIDARPEHLLQFDHARGNGGPGMSCADDRIRFAVFYQIDRATYGRVFLAPHGRPGSVAHVHDLSRMHDGDSAVVALVFLELCFDLLR